MVWYEHPMISKISSTPFMYVTGVVIIVRIGGLSSEMCHWKQPDNSKIALYKLSYTWMVVKTGYINIIPRQNNLITKVFYGVLRHHMCIKVFKIRAGFGYT